MSGKKGMRSELLRVLPAKYDESFASVLDGRCRIARTVRDRLQALVADLGGESALSHQQKSLCRRAIWLEIVLESEELGIGVGRGIDGAARTTAIRPGGSLPATRNPSRGSGGQARRLFKAGRGMTRLTDYSSLRRFQAIQYLWLF
jgi:hypothetical protein